MVRVLVDVAFWFIVGLFVGTVTLALRYRMKRGLHASTVDDVRCVFPESVPQHVSSWEGLVQEVAATDATSGDVVFLTMEHRRSKIRTLAIQTHGLHSAAIRHWVVDRTASRFTAAAEVAAARKVSRSLSLESGKGKNP